MIREEATGSHQQEVEWLTFALIVGCYLVWLLSVTAHESLGWTWIPLAIATLAFQSSLQHEVLHGHPTRSRLVNELLATWGLSLWLPYRRYRSLHLTHHNDNNITDPHDDPESWYCDSDAWHRYSSIRRFLLKLNSTLAGRLIVGPFLVLWGFWVSEVLMLIHGERQVRKAWLLHIGSTIPVLAILWAVGISWGFYLLVVVVPSISVILLRSFIEHRAAEIVGHRTAVVEAGRFWSFMFLNNNLHSVHHCYPQTPWYQLPRLWQKEKTKVLKQNNGYYFAGGYLEVSRNWLFTSREPIIHPASGYKKESPDLYN